MLLSGLGFKGAKFSVFWQLGSLSRDLKIYNIDFFDIVQIFYREIRRCAAQVVRGAISLFPNPYLQHNLTRNNNKKFTILAKHCFVPLVPYLWGDRRQSCIILHCPFFTPIYAGKGVNHSIKRIRYGLLACLQYLQPGWEEHLWKPFCWHAF